MEPVLFFLWKSCFSIINLLLSFYFLFLIFVIIYKKQVIVILVLALVICLLYNIYIIIEPLWKEIYNDH